MLPTLGLCVIAKNGSETIRGCLESARGLIESAVVVDTGSTDGTAAIAQACGARVIHFPWRGDFASARNAALAAIHTDWVLVLDADEELEAGAHAWIRAELAAPHADAYVTAVRNYLKPWDRPIIGVVPVPPAQRHPKAPDADAYVHSEVVRLFRRDPAIYYVGHVHEQVEYRLLELGRPVGRAGFFLHHFGWYRIDAKGLEQKRELYHELLAKKARERPNDTQVLLQYGDALCTWRGEHQKGLDCFLKAATLGGKETALWMHMAWALYKLGHREAALVALDQVPADVAFAGNRAQLKGEVLAGLKRWQEAREAFAEAYRLLPEAFPGEAKLALVEMECGNETGGLARMRQAILKAEAQATAHTEAFPCLCVAELHAQIQQWPQVLHWVERGLALDKGMVELHELRLKAAVATGDLDTAAASAERIAQLKPEPRSFLRHTAILCQNGKRERAEEVISHALEQFPLDDSLQAAGRELGLSAAVPA